MAFRVREIQPTPNPNAAKFCLDRPISEQTISFLNPEQGRGHPLAERLFAIPGVRSLLLLGDFVTVNKAADVDWSDIAPRVKAVLAEAE